MQGLVFQDASPTDEVSPNRADIACFIGFVRRRRLPVPAPVIDWLFANGWPKLSGALLDNQDLFPAQIAPEVATWLIGHNWPRLTPEAIQMLDTPATPLETEIKDWLVLNGWPNLPASLVANRQLHPTVITPVVQKWLLANYWPALQLYVESDFVLQLAVPANVATWLTAQAWPFLAPAVRADITLETTPVPAEVKTWLLQQGWPALDLIDDAGVMTLRKPVPLAVKEWLLEQGWPDIPLDTLNAEDPTKSIISPAVTWLIGSGGWPDPEIKLTGRDLSAATALPEAQRQWLQAHGWRERDVEVRGDDPLLNTPIAVESFDAFDRLFAWEHRPIGQGGFAHTTWMGASVRSFFTQGAARCFIVRVGDPWGYVEPSADANVNAITAAEQTFRLKTLLPGFHGGAQPSRNDRGTWKGIGVLHGLDEIAMIGLPDVPEIVADAALAPNGLDRPPMSEEKFVECSPTVVLLEDETRQLSSSPACDEKGYALWYKVANQASSLLRNYRRDVQLILALPLPAPGAESQADLLALLDRTLPAEGLALRADSDREGIATAFLQLAFPWVKTADAGTLPGGLEAPDGVLLGAVARSAATRGAYRSLGNQTIPGVHGFYPPLSSRELQLEIPPQGRPALIHRVSLLGPTPDGPRVLSDVTTSLDAAHRPAAVGRLTAAILRTARHLGDETSFEPSGPATWRKLQLHLERLLGNFYAAGAFLGGSKSDAYSVRCDETTTSQNDLDNGRVIAEVRFAPAYPIGLITVVLALRESGLSAQEGAA